MASNFFKVDKGVTLAPQSAVASPQNGEVYYDSTRNTYVFRNNGASVDLQSRSDVGTASSLTSANFTATVIQSNLIKLTGSTVSNIHGITASSDAKMIVLYNGSSAVVTIKNASGTESTAGNRILTSTGADVNLNAGEAVQLTYDSTQARWIVVSTPGGSSSGGTGKNYLTTYKNNPGNGNFESASTTGWSLGTTGTLTNGLPTGSPTFGSGASGNLSISTVSSGQLAGLYSLSYASSAATTQGNMLASDAFFIDLEDQAKPITVKFYFKAQTNPQNANWSGTSSNSFAWAIWDVTNSAWIIPAGAFGMTQNSGVGYCTGTFQTSANSTQYRLVVYNANASAGAITVYFDDFFLGPQTAPLGTAIKYQSSYLAGPGTTNFGANIVGALTDSSGTGIYTYDPGTGIYTMLQDATVSIGASLRVAALQAQAAITIDGRVVSYGYANQVTAWGSADWTGRISAGKTFFAYNATGAGSSDIKIVNVQAEQVSTVQMSNDTDTRVVAVSTAIGAPVSLPVSTITQLPFGSSIVDTHAALGVNQYIVPVSGFYRVTAQTTSSFSIPNIANTHIIYVYKNGVSQDSVDGNANGANNSGLKFYNLSINNIYQFNAGDIVTIRYSTDNATNNETVRLNWFNAERLSGPATIAASESVNARYTNSSGQTIANGTITQINSWTRDFDSHNAFASNAYVVPVSGKYQVNIKLLFAGTSMAAGGVHPTAYIYVNGTAVSSGEGTAVTNASEQAGVNMSDIINVNAGDSITVRLQHANGGNRALITIGTANTFSISRVGN